MNEPPPMLWIVGDRLLAEEQWRPLVGESDLVRLDGKRLDVAVLAGEIDTLPMFVDRKWILVQDFKLPEKRATGEAPRGKGSSGRGKGESDPDKELLAAFNRIGSQCSVILVSDAADKRTRLYKLIAEKGRIIDLPTFREYETRPMAEWVAARLHARGKAITAAMALEFVEAVGPDVGMLASEIDKLVTAMGDDPAVTDTHMEVVAGSPVALRRLIDEGIGQKNPARAQVLLQQTLSSNEAPLKVLNFMIPRIRDLLRARLFTEGRSDAQKAATLFGPMHPFRLKTLYEEASRFTPGELRDAMHSLVLADTCLKSSVDPAHVLSLLIAALTGSIDHASFARAVASYVEPWE